MVGTAEVLETAGAAEADPPTVGAGAGAPSSPPGGTSDPPHAAASSTTTSRHNGKLIRRFMGHSLRVQFGALGFGCPTLVGGFLEALEVAFVSPAVDAPVSAEAAGVPVTGTYSFVGAIQFVLVEAV